MIQKRKTAAAKKNKKKASVKRTRTNEINKSIERIVNGKLSDMGLFELSIHALMPTDVFHELKKRIEYIQAHLNICQETTKIKIYKSSLDKALNTVNGLLKNPQKTRS